MKCKIFALSDGRKFKDVEDEIHRYFEDMDDVEIMSINVTPGSVEYVPLITVFYK